MKLIPLTKGLFAKVDDEDFEYLNQWKWTATFGSHNGDKVYARRNGKKSEGPLWRKTIRMHRQLLGVVGNATVVVDHLDSDGLNNQRSNLEATTVSENNLRNFAFYANMRWGNPPPMPEERYGNGLESGTEEPIESVQS